MRWFGVLVLGLALACAACGDSDEAAETTSPQTTVANDDQRGAAPTLSEVQQELMAEGPGRSPVEFAVDMPDAGRVLLEMTANFWNSRPEDTIELLPVDGGDATHAITLHLGAGEWVYRYRVDGEWTVDPRNPVQVEAEAGEHNSVLVVDERLPGVAQRPDTPTGTVERLEIESDKLNRSEPLVVYTPPGYEPGQTYPLLVLLHGFGQPAGQWVDVLGLATAMDNLLADGAISPFVVAMPSAGRSLYQDPVADHILEEVIPYLAENYSLVGGPAQTAVGGFSAGGHGAVQLAYSAPGQFGFSMPVSMTAPWCGMVCGSVDSYSTHYPETFEVDFALWVGINDELGLVTNHELFAQFLDGSGVGYRQTVVEADGHLQDGHSARFIRLIIPDMLTAASEFFEG